MTAEENKTRLRRVFEEGINQGRRDVIDELIAPDYVNHDLPAPAPGAEGFKQVIGLFWAAFPDLRVAVEEVIAEGDTVASRGTMTGTHRGEFMGIPATGRRVAVRYSDVWRVANGRFVENWVRLDMLGMMQQLGVVPASGQA
jgi:steroid delta-isomerase-like uncharacterized protein